MASAPRLDGQPSETLLIITKHLSTTQVFDLRLVCRRLAEQLYPTMPTERIIIADSERQLQMLINMTEPGQPGYILKKLTLVETRPGYLPSEQCIEDGDLEWAEWTTKPSPERAESSSEYQPSEGCSMSEEYDDDVDMTEDWEGENEIKSEDDNDDDLTMEELTTKYAPILKTSDDPTVDWETLWPPHYVPPYYDKDDGKGKQGLPDDIEPTDYAYPLATWDRREKTLTKLLGQAFNNLRHNARGKCLVELDLKAASLKRGIEERDVAQKEPAVMMGELFHRVAVALHITKIPVKKLKIGHASYVLGCEHIAQILEDQCHYTVKLDLKPSLCHLEELYIKFSYTEDKTGRLVGGPGTIVGFLRCMPYLKSLHLHGYGSWSTADCAMLEQIVYSRAIIRESLKTCTLEGFGTRLGEVELFLNHFNTLKSLTLKGLVLATDEYTKLFDIIANVMQELSYLLLDNLFEVESKEGDPDEPNFLHKSSKGLVFFEGDEPSHYPPNRGPNFIKRTGAEARTAIKIRGKYGRSLDSVDYIRWERGWVNNYGGWPWSSIRPLVGKAPSRVNRQLYLQ